LDAIAHRLIRFGLPLNFHPKAIRALAGFTPWARVEQHAIGGADDVDGPALSIQARGPERSIFDPYRERSPIMRQIVRIGLDIAKRWFQVHAVDEAGKEVFNRKLPRDKVLGFLGSLPPCEVALEACSSSHHCGREIGRFGHGVRLISPNYVKPFVKRGKSDAHDARAICEAASRPDMRFVRVKTEEQQAALMQHTSRQLLIDQRTAVANSLRGQLAEFGVIENQGIENLAELVRRLDEKDPDIAHIPETALAVMRILADQLRAVEANLAMLDEQIEAWRQSSASAQALKTIPGVGVLISAALAAHVPEPSAFSSGGDFAAWLGLVPRQNSSGGKDRLRITKQGNPYLRRLLVLGATASLRWLNKRTDPLALWTRQLLQRRPARLVTVALANKLARIAWAIMTTGELYRREALSVVA
jgi:transposase